MALPEGGAMDARRRTWLILATVGALTAVLLVPTAASGGLNEDGDIDTIFADAAQNNACLGDG